MDSAEIKFGFLIYFSAILENNKYYISDETTYKFCLPEDFNIIYVYL